MCRSQTNHFFLFKNYTKKLTFLLYTPKLNTTRRQTMCGKKRIANIRKIFTEGLINLYNEYDSIG